MRILYLCDKLITFILNEVIELKSRGHDVVILSSYSEAIFNSITKPILMKHGLEKSYFRYSSSIYRSRLKRYIRLIKIFVYDLLVCPLRTVKIIKFAMKNYQNPRYGFIYYFEVRDVLDQEIDIIHLPFSTPDALDKVHLISYILNVPFTLCFRAHDIYHLDNFSNVLKRIDVIKKASEIMTIADFNKNHIQSKLDIAKDIEIIHSAVNLDFFKPEDVEKSSNSIVTVCRLSEEKGIVYLLEACHLLNKRNIQYECTIIGEGPEKENYEELIDRLSIPNIDIISYLPHEEIKKYLNRSTVFVLPSIIGSSGLGDIMANSLKEAMAMGVPVITSNIRANGELIDDGINGILIPPKDPVAIADAVESIFDNPALGIRMAEEGRKKIEKDFNTKIEVEKLESIFMKALNKERASIYKQEEHKIKELYANGKR